MAAKKKPLHLVPDQFTEIGSTGLVRYSGYVQEEFLNELKGLKWRKALREMISNDPIIGAMLFAIEYLCRPVEWEVKPAGEGKDEQDKASAQFVDECLKDLSQAWPDLIAEILSFAPWGWSYFETVYKERQGEQATPGNSSKFTDGKIGWRKLAVRAQESLFKWEFDNEGGIQGMTQMAAPSYQVVTIPIEKALLFRTSTHKNNPEGRSLLRSAYRPWYFKKNAENFEGVGIQRELAGIPELTVPARIMAPNASEEDKAIRKHCEDMLAGLSANEMASVMYPSDPWKDSKGLTNIPMYSFKLVQASGQRRIDTRAVIQGKSQEILLCTMTDLLIVGSQKVGSYAMLDKKADLLTEAIGSFLDTIESVFNRHAIPRLIRLNGMPPASAPQLAHGQIQKLSLKDLGQIIGSVQQVLNPREIAYLLSEAGLPKRSEEEIQREEQQRQQAQPDPAQPQQENNADNSVTNPDE